MSQRENLGFSWYEPDFAVFAENGLGFVPEIGVGIFFVA
jgi:hypothetical protein